MYVFPSGRFFRAFFALPLSLIANLHGVGGFPLIIFLYIFNICKTKLVINNYKIPEIVINKVSLYKCISLIL